MKKYFNEVFAWFRDKKREIIPNCLVCGLKHHENLKETIWKNGDQFVTCSECGFVWNANQPTQKILDEFYNLSAPMDIWAEIKNTKPEYKRQGEKFIHIWRFISEKEISSVLDVGCGNGFFLNNAPDKVGTVGIEPNLSASYNCSFPLYKTFKEFEKSLHGKKKYDLITMFGLLEHLKDPLNEVKKYTKFLSTHGYFSFIVPNVKSLIVDRLKEKTATFCPQHLWYFDIKTLSKLLYKANLELIDWTTVEPETQPIIKHIQGFDPYDDIGLELNHHDITDFNILSKRKGYKIIAFFKEGRMNAS